jgi:hypothetical protein
MDPYNIRQPEKFTGYEFGNAATETAADFSTLGPHLSRPAGPGSTSPGGPVSPGPFLRQLGQHWHATLAYCGVFWSFGMCVAFLGPTLLDLGCQTSSDMRAISLVFLAQLLCSLIGATMADFLAQR